MNKPLLDSRYLAISKNENTGGHILSPAGTGLDIELKALSFGQIDESSAIPKFERVHCGVDGEENSFESKAIFPFGAEPEIKRSFEFASGFMLAVTDICLKKTFPMTKLAVDSLKIPGNWKKLTVISASPSEEDGLKMEEFDFDSFTRYESSYGIPALLLENESGLSIETGLCDDIWRWNSGADGGLKSSFNIIKEADGLLIERDVCIWDENAEVQARDWRFKWYMAWADEEYKKASGRKSPGQRELDLENPGEKLHENAYISLEGNKSEVPCTVSNAAQNFMKKALRSAAGDRKKMKFVIKNFHPSLCEDPAHLNRSGKADSLLHWNVPGMLEFSLWADRQLAPTKSKFAVQSSNKSERFAKLPSLRCLAGN